jgi:hypothetical protein
MYFSMDYGVPTVGEQPLLCTAGEQVRPSNGRGERANVGHCCKGSIAYIGGFDSDQLAIVMEYVEGSFPRKSLELPVSICQFQFSSSLHFKPNFLKSLSNCLKKCLNQSSHHQNSIRFDWVINFNLVVPDVMICVIN